MAKRNSPIKQMIKESMKELRHDPSGEFPLDPTMEDDNELSGPERFAKGQKQKDEVVIDAQLADIQNKEGYFLKLKKEIRPGEWMLMKTIETEWRKWPDIESEVAKIVRDHTTKSPTKWGSGPYRIEYACKSGIRGKNYPNVDMHINAEEEFLTNQPGGMNGATVIQDPTTQVTAQLDMLGKLTEIINNSRTPGLDPAKTQEQIAGAFQQGLAIKASEGSNSTQMMTAMMTGLIGMMTAMMTNRSSNEPRVVNPNENLTGMLETLKTFGVLGNQNTQPQKTTIDFVKELREMGMDLFKKDNPLEQITQLKQIASIASDFMGMGGTTERPSVLEKIVDALGPAIPGMVKDLKDTAANAVQVQVEAGKNIQQAQTRMIPPQQGNVESMRTAPNPPMTGSNLPPMSEQVAAFFNGLYEAVNTNNRMFYPVVYTSLLQDAQGQALIQGIANGTHTAKEVIELLQQYGGDRYKDSEFVMKRLVSYTNGFIVWIRDMMKPKMYNETVTGQENNRGSVQRSEGSYDAECQLCHTVYAFDSEKAFIEEKEKVCGVEHNGVICPGIIVPVMKAS
jgi:hypothetical protein